ncbi:MAG TPA: hypothetical protein VM553_05070 [Dongiaceae bacterium]|nr:hypothetical protein [Dongiaceae bacterium]
MPTDPSSSRMLSSRTLAGIDSRDDRQNAAGRHPASGVLLLVLFWALLFALYRWLV